MTTATIGSRLRAAREEAGLTQTEVARRMGVHPETVSRWESGGREPQAESLAALCRAIGCSADDVLGLTPR